MQEEAQVTRRRSVGWAWLLVPALIACGCSSQVAAKYVTHRPASPRPRTPSTTTPSSVPASTPSAVPTTVPTPVRPAMGWTEDLSTVPPGGGFTSLSCLSNTFCIAAGGGTSGVPSEFATGSGVSESWDGAVWSAPSVYFPAPTTGPVNAPIVPAISCTSGPSCLIADGTLHASTGNGTDWGAPAPMTSGTTGAASSAALSCPSPGNCAFVDATGEAAVLRQGTWQTSSLKATSAAGRVGVSCPTDSQCTAIVGSSLLAWNGSDWSQSSVPWTGSPFSGAQGAGSRGSAISCPSTNLCVLVSGTGASTITDGNTWSTDDAVDPRGGLDSISCPTTSLCIAADAAGSVVAWNGTSWSTPEQVIPQAIEYPGLGTSVSCPSDRFCLVLNGDGDYATYSGSLFP